MKKDWPKKRLGDIASVSTGPFGSLLHKADYISDGIPLVNPVNIRDGSIIPNPEKSINEATKRRLSDYTLEEKDVVVGRRGEIGRCAVVGPDEAGWICGTGSFFVRPSLSINPHFLAHSLRSDRYRAQLEKSSTGTTMSNLSNKALENLIIAVPPLLEQERIVIAIDRVSAKIGAAISNAEKNLSNARELLETYLCTIFTQRGAGWIEKRLSSICRQITVGHVGSMAGHCKASGVPFLRSQNIRPFEVSLENVVYIDEAFHAELSSLT